MRPPTDLSSIAYSNQVICLRLLCVCGFSQVIGFKYDKHVRLGLNTGREIDLCVNRKGWAQDVEMLTSKDRELLASTSLSQRQISISCRYNTNAPN